MIKPVKCAECRKEASIHEFLIMHPKDRWAICCDPVECENADIVFARTRLGAILRWNWQCFWENRRMRRKAK